MNMPLIEALLRNRGQITSIKEEEVQEVVDLVHQLLKQTVGAKRSHLHLAIDILRVLSDYDCSKDLFNLMQTPTNN